MSQEAAERLVAARAQRGGRFDSVQQLAERARLDRRDMGCLAAAGALAGLGGHRHRAAWQVAGLEAADAACCREVRIAEGIPLLRAPREGEDIVADYSHTGLTLRRHPIALLRERLAARGMLDSRSLRESRDGTHVRTAGLVITRQRPGSAEGVTFVTLEDEFGSINVIVWRDLAERQRQALVGSRLMGVAGQTAARRRGDARDRAPAHRLEPVARAAQAESRDFH